MLMVILVKKYLNLDMENLIEFLMLLYGQVFIKIFTISSIYIKENMNMLKKL